MAWVAVAAIIGIGAMTGSRFANTDPIALLRYLGAAPTVARFKPTFYQHTKAQQKLTEIATDPRTAPSLPVTTPKLMST